MSTMSATRWTVAFISDWATRSFSNEKAMSSPTVRPTNWPSESCSTVPTFLDRSKRLLCSGAFPSTVREPVMVPL